MAIGTRASASYYRARYYDPQAGRFSSEDPLLFLSGGPNFYPYTANNPVYWRDPSGKIVWIPIIVAAGGGIVGAIGEGVKGSRCGHHGWQLAGDIGRGALSGAAGALTGLYVSVTTGNPFIGGAAGSVAGDLVNGALGGGFNASQMAQNAAIGGALGVVGETVGDMVRVRGGQNFNPLTSPRTFGPRAIQIYAGEVTNHAAEAGAGGESDCGCTH